MNAKYFTTVNMPGCLSDVEPETFSNLRDAYAWLMEQLDAIADERESMEGEYGWEPAQPIDVMPFYRVRERDTRGGLVVASDGCYVYCIHHLPQ